MSDTTTIPTMPETSCPDWCQRDHEADWARDTSLIGPYAIPKTDGMIASGVFTEEDALRMWEPMHQQILVEADEIYFDVSIQEGEDYGPELMWGDRPTTPAKVRELAAQLLEAADRFEAATR
jgi:hypothetical protein